MYLGAYENIPVFIVEIWIILVNYLQYVLLHIGQVGFPMTKHEIILNMYYCSNIC